MQRNFDIQTAPQIPGQERPRAAPPPHQQVRGTGQAGVPATAAGLVRSTVKAGAGALAILILFVLPAEYGIDPTGIGRLTGLTEMGAIKMQLAAEAEADAATAAAPPVAATGDDSGEIAARLSGIEAQLAAMAEVIGVAPVVQAPAASPPVAEAAPAPTPAPAEVAAAPAVESPQPPATGSVDAALAAVVAEPAPAPAAPQWRDDVSVTLAPGEGIEIKLAMEGGQTARFEWSANGAVLNHDTHGDDGASQNVTYAEGRGVSGEVGELTAAFTGNHGWFWRNRSDAPVTLTLRTGGDYARFIAP